MNKIFKVKRNSAGNAVACSEIAKSHTTGKVIATALAVAITGLMSNSASATITTNSETYVNQVINQKLAEHPSSISTTDEMYTLLEERRAAGTIERFDAGARGSGPAPGGFWIPDDSKLSSAAITIGNTYLASKLETDPLPYAANNRHISIGNGAKADNSISLGYFAQSSAMGSIAIGDFSKVGYSRGVALGFAAESDNGGVAIGTESKALSRNEVSFGNNSLTRKLTHISAGTSDTDAVNFAQLKSATKEITDVLGASTTVGTDGQITASDIGGTGKSTIHEAIAAVKELADAGNNLDYIGINSVGAEDNKDGSGATGKNAIAIGAGAVSSGLYSTSIGKYNVASGTGSTALGDTTTASGNASFAGGVRSVAEGFSSVAIGAFNTATARGAVAIGDTNTASAHGAVALGASNKATANFATAIGASSEATGRYSFAQGRDATASGENSIAMGRNTSAQLDDSVALGSGSVAKTNKGVQGYLADGKTDATWQSTSAVMAIGDVDSGITRQIVGLAAGTEDTDAVNVAQLKVVDEKATSAQTTATEAKNLADANKTAINGLNTKLDTKADKTALAATNTKVTNLENTKADKTALDAVKAAADTNKTAIDGLTAKVDTKADKTALAATDIKVAANKTAIDGLTATKADKTALDAVKAAADTNKTAIDRLSATKADKTALAATDSKLAAINTQVAKNTANVAINTADIASLKTQVQNNADGISENAEYIAINAGEILKNTIAIEHLDAVKADKADLNKVATVATTNTSRLDAMDVRMGGFENRMDKIERDVELLDDKITGGLAKQAALAGLFQPYTIGKGNASVALGGYGSETAIAIGAGYRFNDRWAVKAGFATGLNTSDKQKGSYNVGVNYEW